MIIIPNSPEHKIIKDALATPHKYHELASSPSTAVEPQPKTLIASGGKRKEFFGEQKRSPDKLKKQWQVYESGGLYASAIDAYAYSIFANGWRLEGKESFVQEVEENFAGFDFDTVGMQGVIQSLVFGDSIQEAANGRGGKNGKPVAIMMRDSSTFDWDTDDYGIIQSYSQKLAKRGLNETAKKFDPKQLIHLQLIPSGDKYGISLIQRAWDELMRDTRTAEASAEAIDRHGFKKYHVKIGQPGELVKQEVIDNVSDEFEDITTKNEFTTSADVEIKELDEGGLEKIEEYNNISLMRVAAALGLPEEAVGIRRGPLHPDTEVLTKNGWVKIPDAKQGEEILTLNHETKEMQYQSIQNTFKYYVDEDLYHFETKFIDVLCTHDHMVYVKPLHGDKFSLVQANEVPGIFSFMIGGGTWKGEEKEFFEIPSMDIFVGDRWNGGAIKVRTQPSLKIPMDVWMEFLGYFLSEGSTSTAKYSYTVDIHQYSQEGLQQIAECCKKLPFKMYLKKDRVRFYSKQLWTYLYPLGKSHEKHIPIEFKQLSPKLLKILYEALMFGDGCETGYSTVSTKLADDVQELRIKLGLAGVLSQRDRIGEDVILNGKKTGIANYLELHIGKNDSCLYPEIRRNACNGHKQGVFLEHYAGWVHCVEVPNHIMLVRYNGKTCFVGNSTDATAVSRMEFWLKTNISAKQRTVARTYTLQYIDRIVPPGEVKLVFNDIDSTQESSDASWISKIMLASPENPFAVLPPEWIQGRLGVTVQKTLDGKTLPSKDSVPSSKKVVAGT